MAGLIAAWEGSMASRQRYWFKPGRFIHYTFHPITWEGWCVAAAMPVLIVIVVLGLRYFAPRPLAIPLELASGFILYRALILIAKPHTSARE
jgi:hypothetical protein